MVSIGGSSDYCDDSMSLAAFYAEDWVNYGDNSVHPALKEKDSVRPQQDLELIRILTKAVTDYVTYAWTDLPRKSPPTAAKMTGS